MEWRCQRHGIRGTGEFFCCVCEVEKRRATRNKESELKKKIKLIKTKFEIRHGKVVNYKSIRKNGKAKKK